MKINLLPISSRRHTKLLLLLLAVISSSATAAPNVNWINWTDPSSPRFPNTNPTPEYKYRNGVNGLLTLPDATVVDVTLVGEVIAQSCFTALAGDCPAGFWRNVGGWGPSEEYPAGTFTSANVPDLPATANQISQAGYSDPVHTMTFSQSVTDIVMNIFTLGTSSDLSSYQFNQPFVLLSQNPRCNSVTGEYCLAVEGTTLSGREGSGTIRFTGTVESISWTVTVPEYYSGFTIGAASAIAPPVPNQVLSVPTLSEWGMLLLGLVLISLVWQYRRGV